MKVVNRQTIYAHLLEKMFNILELTTFDALFNKNWRDWTITIEQYEKFKRYSIALIKKTFKINTNKAKATFEWYWEVHGLKIK